MREAEFAPNMPRARLLRVVTAQNSPKFASCIDGVSFFGQGSAADEAKYAGRSQSWDQIAAQRNLRESTPNHHRRSSRRPKSFSGAGWVAKDAAEARPEWECGTPQMAEKALPRQVEAAIFEFLPHMRRAHLEKAARDGSSRPNGTCAIFVIKRWSQKPNLPAPVARLDFANILK